MTQKGKMTAGELLPKLPELLMDLDTLHRAGIIHRDISPDNLILMPNGKLKLLDFGSARSVQDGKSMTILLKAGFSPVEQYQSRGQGAWTDVYALAATIYYCLTGVIPPSSVDRLEEDELQKPNALGAGLTAEQEEALVWGLVVQPKSRPASMEIFHQRLFPTPPPPICGGNHGIPPVDPLSKLRDTVNNAADTAKDAFVKAKDVVSGAAESVVNKINQSAEKTTEAVEPPKTVPNEEKPETPITTPETPVTGPENTEDSSATVSVPVPKRRKPLLMRILIGLGGLAAAALLIFLIFYLVSHGTTDDGYVYRLELGDYAVITGYKGEGGAIVIPEEIRNLSVEYIDDRAFENHTEITSITIPTKAFPFSRVFSGCSGITLVIFDGEDDGETISSVWEDDLEYCKNLRCVFFTNAAHYENCIEKEQLADLENITICHKGQDTGFGLIKSVEVIDDIVYALTDAKYAVILQMPDALDGDSLSPMLGAFTVILPDGRMPGQVDPIEGVTSDGYSYYISADRSECIITGYTGGEAILDLPDKIEGCPVNIIGENAFAGNTAIESVFFPDMLEQIRDSAFSGCSELRDIYVSSNCSADSSAFQSCPRLRCAVLDGNDITLMNWTLPSDLRTYYYGMATGIGMLDYVGVSNLGVIYGITKDEIAVVMDIPDDVTEIEILSSAYDCPVKWIYSKALDGVSSSAVIHLPTETLFAYTLWDKADWQFLDSDSQYTLAECWWYSCYLCALISEERGSDPMMTPDEALVRAAVLRAREQSELDSYTRPNGEDWGTVLKQFEAQWTYASAWRYSFDNSDAGSGMEKGFNRIVEYYAPPEDDHNNEYYTRIGFGLYYDAETDKVFLSCIAAMRD